MFVTYDLVTHGASGKECWGTYDSGTHIGYGASFMNNCVHSGSNNYSGGNTVWYGYTLASAGTIADKNTTVENPANNSNTATESVCPKGWSLPFTKQIDSNRSTSSFSPVLGGVYSSGTLYNESTHGYWWGAEMYNGANRYLLDYNSSSLYTNYSRRYGGFYIRCVSEEKTVTDLTYMQDYDTTSKNSFSISEEYFIISGYKF